MRVGEGSAKKKEIERIRKILKKTFENRSRKSDGTCMKKPSNSDPKIK